MPIYSETLSIPADTSEEDPVALDVTLKQKYITKMEVGFPPGCCYFVKVKIQYGIKQFWPERRGAWISGNNETVSWGEKFEIPSVGEKLTVYGCSPATHYNHVIIIRFMTLPKGFYFLETLLNKLFNLLKKII